MAFGGGRGSADTVQKRQLPLETAEPRGSSVTAQSRTYAIIRDPKEHPAPEDSGFLSKMSGSPPEIALPTVSSVKG